MAIRFEPFLGSDGGVTQGGERGPVDSDACSKAVIGAGMRVHSALGPGFLESTYRACLAHELHVLGLRVRTEVPLPVTYKGIQLDVGYRVDLLVEEIVIVELKVVEKLLRVHEAQLLAYLKLSGIHVGLLINFNVPQLRLGIKRLVNNYKRDSPPRTPGTAKD